MPSTMNFLSLSPLLLSFASAAQVHRRGEPTIALLGTLHATKPAPIVLNGFSNTFPPAATNATEPTAVTGNQTVPILVTSVYTLPGEVQPVVQVNAANGHFVGFSMAALGVLVMLI